MRFVADLHIHSHFSRATSSQLTPEHLDHWGRVKGIKVIGTGDFTHPGWVSELEDKLEPDEPGLFRLRRSFRLHDLSGIPESQENSVRFLLTGEISNIYKRDGAVRKVHNLVLAPDFEAVNRVRAELERLGFNLKSDGRPILGLDSRDLLEILLSASPRIVLVPAHIWTPWFSVLGAKSGFDSVEECYRDLASHITAVETGLSSDPPMNWRCSRLDRFALISNSDAHSPEKLGREANIFDAALSYDGILAAIKGSPADRLYGTIEFFPEEGKYHYDGHRKCQVVWAPEETERHGVCCSSCGKPVTVGVMNRVLKLADRNEGEAGPNRVPFYSAIPLSEILGELLGTGAASKKVQEAYRRIVHKAGSELDVLLWAPLEDLARLGGSLLEEAVRRMRTGQVIVQAGYDGEYGVIKLFTPEELKSFGYKAALFVSSEPAAPQANEAPSTRTEYLATECASGDQLAKAAEPEATYVPDTDRTPLAGLNPEQRRAAEHMEGAALVIAGPGTGKTRVLTARVAWLINEKKIEPGSILVVTFTNRAAGELRQRLVSLLGEGSRLPWIGTFHSFGYSILAENPLAAGREPGFDLVDEEEREAILARLLGCSRSRATVLAEWISRFKATGELPEEECNPPFEDAVKLYNERLREENLFDLDDLIMVPVRLFRTHPGMLNRYRERYPWVLIDEYQDVNLGQYDLVRLLAPDSASHLFAIGDPNQAIYGFRGSDVRFIGRFLKDYPAARSYRLERSYRCSQNILRASEGVLGRPEAGALRGTAPGLKLKIVPESSEKSEAEFVARTIEAQLGGVRFFSLDSEIASGHEDGPAWGFSDFAILCRLSAQMPVLEKALQDHGIPYQKVEEAPFFRREPVRTIVDILRLARRPDRVLPRQRLEEHGVNVAAVLEALSHASGDCSVSDLISSVLAENLGQSLFANAHAADLERLRCLAGEFGTDLEGFLRHVSLGSAPDGYRPGIENVALMTLHAAKGLEFRCVFIPGCEEGILPCTAFAREVDSEEERRLLYVGMTRARDLLFLSHAGRRFLAGRPMENAASRFLGPIDRQLVEVEALSRNRGSHKPDPQLRLF